MDKKERSILFYIGLIECILAIVLLIVGIFFVGTAYEDNYSSKAQSGSFIVFFIFLCQSVLLGVTGWFTMKEKGSWGISIIACSFLLFGDLFMATKIWLWVVCIFISTILGLIGLIVGLNSSLFDK